MALGKDAGLLIDLSNLPKLVNDKYMPALRSQERFLVLYGGSGSGKSYAAAQKLLMRILSEEGHRFLCVRNTAASVSKSQFPLLIDELNRWGLSHWFKVNRSVGREKITCIFNNNEILFSGLDDVEKLKSIAGITSIWVEEASEVSVEDFRELNRRLRGYSGVNKTGVKKYMQIMMTFNPISALHWLKPMFFDNKREDALVIHSTYKDNKFIDAQYGAELERLKEESPYEYEVYALGNWGVAGGAYFDGQQVTRRYEEIRDKEPVLQGYFEYGEELSRLVNMSFVENVDGQIRVFRDVDPGIPYVIGADTAGDGSDYNVGHVINNITGEQVATIRQQYDEDLFAKQLYSLGMYFNTALIGVENNFSTHVTKTLERLMYPAMYVRERSPDAYTGRLTDKFGFLTTRVNRMDMLGRLRMLVREQVGTINDIYTLEEMTTFILSEKGRPEAASGHHDDCIMALAITHAIRYQQTMEIAPEVFDVSNLPEDVQDDYFSSSDDMRRRLLKKWGFIKEVGD